MKTQILPTATEEKQRVASAPHFSASGQESEEGRLSLDIFETSQELIFLVPVAGVKLSKLEILISEDILTISGERSFPEDIFTEEKNAFLEECYWGKFSRSVVLPAAVDSDSASARCRDNILIIRIPKIRKVRSKRLPIEILS